MKLKTKADYLNAFVQANKIVEKQSQYLDDVYEKFLTKNSSNKQTVNQIKTRSIKASNTSSQKAHV